MKYTGTIIKMESKNHSQVVYRLPIGEDEILMNDLIGKYISMSWDGEIYCIGCGRKTNKSFAQGYWYPCMISAPETAECILRPELCEAHNGISRDMDWAKYHCLIDHYVYLSLTSGLKVGVTRSGQIPARWIDQGASKAIILAQTSNRYEAGLIEVALKKQVSDRTIWQRMLKNEYPRDINLITEKQRLVEFVPDNLKSYISKDDEVTDMNFPVNEYPEKIKSLNFDKHREIYGVLWGIKGQYLIFDDGSVLNIRRHNGYLISFDV